MRKKYTIGMDYGTLSGRGVLVSCEDGRIVASAVKEYSHGVMDKDLPETGEKLPSDWALEHPLDYIEVLSAVIPVLLRKSDISPNDIIGIGIDFTSCTVLPIDQNAVPLCMKEKFKYRRNSYAKLWKHHGAQRFADQINRHLEEQGLADSPRFGGKVSSELMLPKVLEILEEDPEVYNAAEEILEAGDWLTRLLTGSHSRSCSMAGYKAWWNERDGYPEETFFTDIHPGLSSYISNKLPGEVVAVGKKIGTLSEKWAEKLGLPAGIAVAPAVIDSHAGVPGSGVYSKEQAMLVLGTSSVMIGLGEFPFSKEGVVGGVRDAIVPGYYAYESGLAAVGDLFAWFTEHLVPASYAEEAGKRGISLHTLLGEKASDIGPGRSGLLALDWWSGNKTPFVDGSLKGALIGMSLNTKPEEIYRSLIEATACGTRRILELYENNGIQVREIICSGGISLKNPLLMQIYADLLGKRLIVAKSEQAAALGSAVYAALSAGESAGGYDNYEEAVKNMCQVENIVYEPNQENFKLYTKLYSIYKDFSEMMGNSNREIMRRLHELQTE